MVFSFPGGAVAATDVVASAGVRSASATSIRRPQKGAVSTGERVGAGTCVWETANKAIVAVLHTWNPVQVLGNIQRHLEPGHH